MNVDHALSSMNLSSDGRLLVCGSQDGCVEILDVAGTGTTTIPCFEDGAVDAVAFSPDGATLACGGGERGLTKIVDTRQRKLVATLRTWGGWKTDRLAFSPDGKRLATADGLGRVAIWDMTSLRKSLDEAPQHNTSERRVASYYFGCAGEGVAWCVQERLRGTETFCFSLVGDLGTVTDRDKLFRPGRPLFRSAISQFPQVQRRQGVAAAAVMQGPVSA